MPPIKWLPITALDDITRNAKLITLKVDGKAILASWHTDPATGRSFWWNGDVTDDGEAIEIHNPTDWALVDLAGYKSFYEALIRRRNASTSGLPGSETPTKFGQ